MLILGLTGGIGTGKSTAAQYFINQGFAHIDADQIGRDMTADGMPMVDRLGELFGPEILVQPGVLDRKVMADLVFQNEDIRATFNKLMHTAIIDEIKNRIDEVWQEDAGQGTTPGILIDAPLLFEAGVDRLCNRTILITADLELRIRRVCERDGVTEDKVRQRIASQMDDDAKRRLADYVIENDGTVEELYRKLDEIPLFF